MQSSINSCLRISGLAAQRTDLKRNLPIQAACMMGRRWKRKYTTEIEGGRYVDGHSVDMALFGVRANRLEGVTGQTYTPRKTDASGHLSPQDEPSHKNNRPQQAQQHKLPSVSGRSSKRVGRKLPRAVLRHPSSTSMLPPSSKQPHGVKRKAENISGNERLAQAKKPTTAEPFMDEDYIRKNMSCPTKNEYPTAPNSLFERSIVNAVHNIGNNVLQLSQEYTALPSNRFRCIVTGILPDGLRETAVGDGRGKQEATRAAYLHFMSKLHVSGVLKEIFPPKDTKLDKQTMQEEAGAKVDIYNYAARFALIPEFSIRKIATPFRGRRQSEFEVTIKLREQNIRVVARGTNLRAAEITAAVRFKKEAEQYHAEHGHGSMVIKDATTLNTGNISNFLEYYKVFHEGVLRTLVTPGWDVVSARNDEDLVSAENDEDSVSTGKGRWQGQAMLKGEPFGPSVVMPTKKAAEQMACLVGAVTLIQTTPSMLDDFARTLKSSVSGQILAPLRLVDMDVDSDAVLIMQETLQEVRRAGLPDQKEDLVMDEDIAQSDIRIRRLLSEEELEQKSLLLQRKQHIFAQDPQLSELVAKKEALPMNQYRQQVLNHIQNNRYSVIVGATGSGKTTQVPQILLEDAIQAGIGAQCNVICTQPRRIAATSVARRVAEERNEHLRDSVGYHVRFDSKLPQQGGSITYCTTGILLQQLQRSPDQILDNVSHIVIDEVHERDILIDFLMIIIKKSLQARLLAGKSTPKVVLMSATIDSELFSKYFEHRTTDGRILPCPSLSIPGRTFPVKEKYFDTIISELEQTYSAELGGLLALDRMSGSYVSLERQFSGSNVTSVLPDGGAAEATIDWKRENTVFDDGQITNEMEDSMVPTALVAATIAHICKTSDEGAILVFLPGYDEIKNVMSLLTEKSPLGLNFVDPGRFRMFMLHSSVPATEQADVFNPLPGGCRKIILSTNIAETSITIPDIQYVVDTGKLREKRYDQIRRITKLQCTWISKSNAKQRAGRAGRVRNGNYYALYSKARFDSLRSIGLPEMLRSDLQEICLAIKAQAFKSPIREFLSAAIEPPPPAAVDISVKNLQSLEALTEDERLTPLGRLLASLPVHPSLGKMIVLGIIFRCLDPMIILGAVLNERSLFVSPPERRTEAQAVQADFSEGYHSDHYAIVNAFRQMRTIGEERGQYAMQDFAHRHFCHVGAFRTLDQTTRQIEEILVEHGLIPYLPAQDRFEGEIGHPALNKNATNVALLRALVLAGTYPNLAVCTGGITFRTPSEKNALLHPSSLNAPRKKDQSDMPVINSLYLFSTMQKSNDGKRIFLRDTTLTTPLITALFGGRLTAKGPTLEVDGWLPFQVYAQRRAVQTVMEFRKALDRLLTKAFGDMAKLRIQNRERLNPMIRSSTATYLADDEVREAFASGLVEVLKKDISGARLSKWARQDDDASDNIRGISTSAPLRNNRRLEPMRSSDSRGLEGHGRVLRDVKEMIKEREMRRMAGFS